MQLRGNGPEPQRETRRDRKEVKGVKVTVRMWECCGFLVTAGQADGIEKD